MIITVLSTINTRQTPWLTSRSYNRLALTFVYHLCGSGYVIMSICIHYAEGSIKAMNFSGSN